MPAPMRCGKMIAAVLFLAVFAAAFVQSLQANTIYQETFPNAGSVNATYDSVGWFGYGSSTCATIGPNGSSGVFSDNGLSFIAGSDSVGGYAFAKPGNVGGFALVATAEVAPLNIDLSAYNGLAFSWLTKNDATTSTEQLAIEIGGVWYVSGTSITASASGAWITEALSLSSVTSWYALTVSPGSTLSLNTSTTASLPTSGSIDAVGLYLTGSGTSVVRLDNFTISGTAVPEPSALALFGVLATIATALVWRKRKN